jgi:alkaline phosphatase D
MLDSTPLDRRRLLRLAAAAALAASAPRAAWPQPRIAESPFRLGVASGAPAADGMVLWTRLVAPELAVQPVAVRWEIADDEAFQRVVQRGQAEARPELAHSVHVEAAGLEADRGYFYRFQAGGWMSPAGRTRTLPRPDAAVARLKLAFASCQRWEHGYFGAYRHMRDDAPDAVLFLGDYLYEYPSAPGAVRATDGVWCATLDDYRRRYALYKGDAHLQAMHAACPWIVTWDDHEVQNDYAGAQRGNAGPVVADFAARRAAAYQAYYEHMPLRAADFARALASGASPGALPLQQQFRFGRLAQLCMLDLRQHRSPQVCNPRGRAGSATIDPATCAAWDDPARTLLGAAQEQWLDAQLAAGGAGWTLLGQATLFGARDFRPGPGQMLWNDGWDGYAAARARLVQSLQRHAPANPVLLGGDIHENWVGHVKADYARPESAAVGVEFCGTSLTSRPIQPEHIAERLADNPHFVHADASGRGYGIAELTAGRMEVSLRVTDDVERPDPAMKTQARFAVAAGRPVVERA